MLEPAKDKRHQLEVVDMESLVPQDHLLRKIDEVLDFSFVYELVSDLYCADNGRPAVDPVVLVKIILIQHLYGIRSLRQTLREVEMNIAYRWFLHYGLRTEVPHLATVSYAFATRFPSEVFEAIFVRILNEAVKRGFVKADALYIDATQTKANANRKKNVKKLVERTARVYEERLWEELNADREAHGKKPFPPDDEGTPPEVREVTASATDPDAGLFRKGEHKVEFAYTVHTACDRNNFIVASDVTPGNVHDSVVFDSVYDTAVARFPQAEVIAVDAGYKTPWILKKVLDDGRDIATPYKRPMTRQGFFKSYEYVYDEYHDCVLCPMNHVLPYSTTNRDGYREYKSNPPICRGYPQREKCTHAKTVQKTVCRHIWSEYLERAEDYRHSPEGKAVYALRSTTIERVFADAKEKHGMRYTPHRGLDRVTNWVKMKFAAMNLKKLALWAARASRSVSKRSPFIQITRLSLAA